MVMVMAAAPVGVASTSARPRAARRGPQGATPFFGSVRVAAASGVSGRRGAEVGAARVARAPGVGPRRAAGPRVATTAQAAAAAAPGLQWKGADPVKLAISVAVGAAVRFLIPVPAGVTPQAWQLLAIFLSTVTGLVLTPVPVGAWAFLGLTAAVVTKTLTFSAAFSAFTSEAIWLIVISFFFARGFVTTGLGDRVANLFVKAFGKSTLGLAYGLALGETVISPAMPSTTARAGGVFIPVMKSLAINADSVPEKKTQDKMAAFMFMSTLQTSSHTSAIFLTAAAQNLLCLKLASELGVIIPNAWTTWFIGGLAPGLVGLLLNPLFLYKIMNPTLKESPEAPIEAQRKLDAMGAPSQDQWIMMATMALLVGLWVGGEALGISSVVAAMVGLCILLLTGVTKWDDCLSEKAAWDTLAWFAVLVGMSGQLSGLGLISWISGAVSGVISGMGLTWGVSFAILHMVYYFIHYLFASQTAHVGALFAAFLAMMISAGVPGPLAALSLAYTTNLFGSNTHYASGQSAVYYASDMWTLPEFWKLGMINNVFNLIVWFGVGMPWWKLLGYW